MTVKTAMKIIDTVTDRDGCGYTVAVLSTENLTELSAAELRCFPEDPWTVGMLEDTLQNDRSIVIGVYNRQMTKIVAYGVLYIAADEADVANIAVMPENRGCGVGYSLLSKMINIAHDNRASRIFLEVRESNAAAIGLYKKFGFAEIGKRRNYYVNPLEDAIVMILGGEI